MFSCMEGSLLLGSGLVLEAMWYMNIYVYFDTSLVLNPVKITVYLNTFTQPCRFFIGPNNDNTLRTSSLPTETQNKGDH